MNTSLRVPLWFVILAVLACAGWALTGGRVLASRWSAEHASAGPHDLEWLERSFPSAQDNAEALRRVHARHAAERVWAVLELDRVSRRVAQRAQDAGEWSPELQADIAAWDQAAAKSHLLTWRYIYEMSACLSPEDGRAYRVEMARRILGSVPPDSEPGEGGMAQNP